jgi:hypothetical protein
LAKVQSDAKKNVGWLETFEGLVSSIPASSIAKRRERSIVPRSSMQISVNP